MTKTELFRLILGTALGLLLMGSVPLLLAPFVRQYLADQGMVVSDEVFARIASGLLLVLFLFVMNYVFEKLIPERYKKRR